MRPLEALCFCAVVEFFERRLLSHHYFYKNHSLSWALPLARFWLEVIVRLFQEEGEHRGEHNSSFMAIELLPRSGSAQR
jgi:hypothetical protein